MIITKLYSGDDGKSHFTDIDCGHDSLQPLGHYSKKFPASGIIFRDFEAGRVFDLHTAPQPQYIVYLEGEVEVSIPNGETRIFKAGDVLLATDTEGEGHISKMLTSGKSIIITTE